MHSHPTTRYAPIYALRQSGRVTLWRGRSVKLWEHRTVFEVRRLTGDDWGLWRMVRLEALTEAPYAFGSTLASWLGAGDHEQRWRDRLTSVPCNVVAEVEGRPIGQVSGTATDEHDSVELISMWVTPELRGGGVGEALIDAVVDWATSQGAHAVTLAVKIDNPFAICLYRRTGFTTTEAAADPGEQVMIRRIRPT